MRSIRRLKWLLLMIPVSSLMAQDIHLSDYGVIPWSFENASPATVRALASVKGKEDIIITFPGGRIDLWPDGAVQKELYISNTTEDDSLPKLKHIAVCLENMSNITIEGNNTLVVLHGKMVSFGILNSKNVTIRNIRFDYERPTMSELKVTALSDSAVKLRIHPDSRYQVRNGEVIFYGEQWRSRQFHTIRVRPEEDLMYYSSWKPFSTSEARRLFPDTLLFKGDFYNAAFQRGDILTIRDPYRDNCGAFINLSKNVVLENIKMHYMHGMGIVSQFSENITIKNVEVAPREETNRVIAAFADCFHFSGCKGLVMLDSCRTSGSHDDPVNVHGTHLKIVKIEQGNNLRVRFMHHQTYGFKAFFSGDSIAFVKPENLLVYDTGVVKSAKLISKREMLLEIEGDLPASLESGHCLENITWTPEVIVRNCRFRRTNTRGLLVTTRRSVLIENNTFYRTGMHAILIANDCNFWYESGPVKNVTIRGNAFIQCGYNKAPESYVIAIQPETHNFIENRYIHSNIRIENNSFDCIAGPVLSARSVRNLDFKNNVVHFKPMQNAAEESSASIVLEHCSGVRIPNNRVSGFTEARLILIDITPPSVNRGSKE